MRYLLIGFSLLLLTACGGNTNSADNQNVKTDSLSTPANISRVVGIGKVEPEKGIVELASDAGGIVDSIGKQAGDSLQKGDIIIRLRQLDAKLKVQQLKDQIATQKQEIKSNKIDVGQYEAQLDQASSKLAISEKLAKSGAETAENVEAQRTDEKVLTVKMQKSKNAVNQSLSKLNELQSELNSAEHTLDEKTVKAPSDGILLTNDARKGAAIEPLTSFATFAPKGPTVVHGEADEMFANRLKIGQKVDIHYIGDSTIVTTGKINFLSPLLSNKSLFTDVPGEQQDRRVRRFKVLLDDTDELLINNKVECVIHLNSK